MFVHVCARLAAIAVRNLPMVYPTRDKIPLERKKEDKEEEKEV
jgi:hypothetical protein